MCTNYVQISRDYVFCKNAAQYFYVLRLVYLINSFTTDSFIEFSPPNTLTFSNFDSLIACFVASGISFASANNIGQSIEPITKLSAAVVPFAMLTSDLSLKPYS